MLDTAIGYGDSEVCLGEVGAHSFDIVTKLPVVSEDCVDVGGWVIEQVMASCNRLKVDKVYGLLLHRPADLFGSNGKKLINALQNLKQDGLVQKVGVSIYSPRELDSICKLFRPDIVQAPFNLVDRRLYTSRWLHRLKQQGVEIHIRSIFLQGLLLMDKNAIPPKFFRWNKLWEIWHSWLVNHDESALRLCLGFPLSFSEIDRILVGVDSVAQLKQIVDSSRSSFPTDFPYLQSDDNKLINPSNWNCE